MGVDRSHIFSLFLFQTMYSQYSSKEAFVYFVCPTEIPQPPFASKYYYASFPHFFLHPVC